MLPPNKTRIVATIGLANPCVLARISHEELDQLFRGYGYTPKGYKPEELFDANGRFKAEFDQVVNNPFVLGWKWGEKGPVTGRSSTEADNV